MTMHATNAKPDESSFVFRRRWEVRGAEAKGGWLGDAHRARFEARRVHARARPGDVPQRVRPAPRMQDAGPA